MRYMGSKNRIARYILPIILKGRKPGQYYVEPFCGGLNTIQEVDGNRIAADVHNDLMRFYHAIQNGWKPPQYINEDDYARLKKHCTDPVLRGYVGFLFSFGSKFMDSYRRQRDNRIAKNIKRNGTTQKEFTNTEIKNNYASMDYTNQIAKKNVEELRVSLAGLKLHCCDYRHLKIPPQSIVYCDIPYRGTTEFKGTQAFNHNLFYDWCRLQKAKGHTVFVSEYYMPKDFKCVWSRSVKVYLNNSGQATAGDRVEKLYTL